MSQLEPLLDWADLPAVDVGIAPLMSEWVFAYGSLIWDPGFEYAERHRVSIHGYHRAFCIRSIHYRGTAAAPGVVLGLDRGGSCQGIAYRLHATQSTVVIDLLYRREMAGDSYEPRLVPIKLDDGRSARALTFVADRSAAAYVRLDDREILRRLTECVGSRGENYHYAVNTLRALTGWGIRDQHLARIVRNLGLPGRRTR